MSEANIGADLRITVTDSRLAELEHAATLADVVLDDVGPIASITVRNQIVARIVRNYQL